MGLYEAWPHSASLVQWLQREITAALFWCMQRSDGGVREQAGACCAAGMRIGANQFCSCLLWEMGWDGAGNDGAKEL